MSGIQYVSVIPQNYKTDGYSQYDNVDFLVSYPGRKINLGTVRLTGVIEPKVGANAVTNQKVYYDPMVGAHNLFDSIAIRTSAGIIENLTEYPRMVKMISQASSTPADMCNSENMCELKVPMLEQTQAVLQGETVATQAARNTDFSIKPEFMLNNCVSQKQTLSYTKLGDFTVSVTMNRNHAVFFGEDADNATYIVKDLRLEFTTYPDDGDKEELAFATHMCIKQSIQSSLANISTNVPMLANAVSMSFLYQSKENQAKVNNLEMDRPPNMEELIFLFNNATNEYVSYPIKDQAIVIDKYVDSLGASGHNAVSIANVEANNAYGVGLNLNTLLDFSRNKFGVQINSELLSATPMIVFMYFSGMVKL